MIVTPEVATIPHSSPQNDLTQNDTYEMTDSAATTSPSTPTDTSLLSKPVAVKKQVEDPAVPSFYWNTTLNVRHRYHCLHIMNWI